MPNDELNSNPPLDENGAGAPKKSPLDQWVDGELSTISIIDRLLAFIGIYPNK